MEADLARYARQTIYPGIGEAGQRRLLDAHVTIIGVGATGSVLANHLAARAWATCGWWTATSSS